MPFGFDVDGYSSSPAIAISGSALSQLPFGFDVDGYLQWLIIVLKQNLKSQLPFGFDVDGYPDAPLAAYIGQNGGLNCLSALMSTDTGLAAGAGAAGVAGSQLPFGFDVDGYIVKVSVWNLAAKVKSQLPFGFDVDGYKKAFSTTCLAHSSVSIAFRL